MIKSYIIAQLQNTSFSRNRYAMEIQQVLSERDLSTIKNLILFLSEHARRKTMDVLVLILSIIAIGILSSILRGIEGDIGRIFNIRAYRGLRFGEIIAFLPSALLLSLYFGFKKTRHKKMFAYYRKNMAIKVADGFIEIGTEKVLYTNISSMIHYTDKSYDNRYLIILSRTNCIYFLKSDFDIVALLAEKGVKKFEESDRKVLKKMIENEAGKKIHIY